MGGLSWWHWLIILAVFILLFGAKKLPDAARGVGRSLRILKSEVSAMHDDEAAKGKVEKPSETDASAAVATPAAQLTPAPLPPVAAPAYQQPAAGAQPVYQQPVGAPQPQYAQPQYAQPQNVQPQYAQPQYAQPQYQPAPQGAPVHPPVPTEEHRAS